MDLPSLILSCTAAIAPEVMSAIIDAESGGDGLLITAGEERFHPEDEQAAIALAREMTAAGRRLHLGLAQMSSDGLSHYGLTLETVFDPCESLRAAEIAVMEGYVAAYQVAPGVAAVDGGSQPQMPAWQFAPAADGFLFPVD